MFTLPPLHSPGLVLLGKSVWLRAFLLDPTAAAGPDECAGQARPRVAPPAHQHLCAPAGKATTPGLGPHSVPRVQNQPAKACRDLPHQHLGHRPHPRTTPPHPRRPQWVRQLGPIEEEVTRVTLTERTVDWRSGRWRAGPAWCPQAENLKPVRGREPIANTRTMSALSPGRLQVGCQAQHRPGRNPVRFKSEALWTQTLALPLMGPKTSGKRMAVLSFTVTLCGMVLHLGCWGSSIS